MINVVILAGGSGTRLWPSSRSGHPKQFLNLHNTNSLLQNTFLRLDSLSIDKIFVICNNDHRFFVAEQIKELNVKADIILEPIGKNTAPAIAIASMFMEEESLMLVLSADHIIKDQDAFHNSIKIAKIFAENNKLVNFGVQTSSAHTGYGYIKCGEQVKMHIGLMNLLKNQILIWQIYIINQLITFGIVVCSCSRILFF